MCRYERLWELGKAFGLQHVGLQALASLRMEKGYRDYGHDMDNTDRILESGLAFTCDFDKPGGFIGKEATLKHKLDATGGKGTGTLNLAQRLVLFRAFYVQVVIFVYFTRIVAYLVRATMPCRFSYFSDVASEAATLLFFVSAGLKFRPRPENP